MHHDHMIAFAITFTMIAFHVDFEINVTHEAILHGFAMIRHFGAVVAQAAFNANTAI